MLSLKLAKLIHVVLLAFALSVIACRRPKVEGALPILVVPDRKTPNADHREQSTGDLPRNSVRPSDTGAAPEDWLTRFSNEEYATVNGLSKLPEPVRQAFSAYVQDEPMADEGAPWQSTDVVIAPGLPSQRFIIGGIGPSFGYLLYEAGGRGHSERFLLLDFRAGHPKIIHACWAIHLPTDLKQLKSFLRRGKCEPASVRSRFE